MSYRVISLLLLLFPAVAGAATWYVRPNTAEYGAEDGSSYAAAFDGPEDIAWGAPNVQAGDTLVFCGTFNAGSGATYWITVGASGSTGLPITITGDCSSQGDLSRAVLDGDGVRVAAFTTNTQTYIDFEALEITDFTTRGLYLTNTTSPDQTIERYINVDDVYIHDIDGNAGASPTCITVQGRYVSVTNSTIENCGDDNLSVRGKYFTATNNTFAGSGIDTTTGDCIALGGSTAELDGYSIVGNTCNHKHEDEKQCFVMSLSGDNPSGRFSENICEMPIGATAMVGLLVDAGNYVIERNFFRGGNVGIQVGNATSYSGVISSNIIVSPTQDGIKNDFGFANQTVTQANNVIFGAGRYGINSDCNHSTCVTPTYNNIIVDAGTACLRTLNATFTHLNNAVNGCEPYMVNTTPTTPDSSTISGDPEFIGGSDSETYRLKSSSPLLGAGYPTSNKYDYNGVRFSNPPSIGAYSDSAFGFRSTYSFRNE